MTPTATLTAADRAAAIDRETSQFSSATRAPSAAGRWAMSARAAYQLLLYGRAMLVDIRSASERRVDGEIDPALGPVVVDAALLERRFHPRSTVRFPWVTDETRVLVLDQEGYASSPAAATLVRLGLTRATEVVGGLRAWREAGLPLAA
jgi:rhodanese-related sulfurtransferase